MEVILLERVGKLGHMGDVVRVKDGFARNFLLPQGKAYEATKGNLRYTERLKAVRAERVTIAGSMLVPICRRIGTR